MSNLGPRLYAAFNREDEAVGVFGAHIDDLSGRGAPGVLERTRHFSEQGFGALKTQEHVFAHSGMELTQKAGFSIELAQAEFTKQLTPLDTSPALWKARQRPLPDEGKLG